MLGIRCRFKQFRLIRFPDSRNGNADQNAGVLKAFSVSLSVQER
jgi:hypothetical protein